MSKIRRSHDRLIFNMGIHKPGKMVFILYYIISSAANDEYDLIQFSKSLINLSKVNI